MKLTHNKIKMCEFAIKKTWCSICSCISGWSAEDWKIDGGM